MIGCTRLIWMVLLTGWVWVSRLKLIWCGMSRIVGVDIRVAKVKAARALQTAIKGVLLVSSIAIESVYHL